MAAVDRICEACHKVSRTEAEVCPDDGGRLSPIARDEDFVGRVIDDKLTLTGVIGRGGMGVVYRARQHSMDREVAVKLLHPSFADDAGAVKRFLHEAKAASLLDHPNVITVFDFGRTEDGLLYLVMELLIGAELAQAMAVSPLGVERAVHVLAQVCDALHHAHERGLVHRDLKPENVFLLAGSALRRDFVKVLDFGIARMRSYEGIERLTQTGSICGTPAYMSPEQVLGDEVDRRSDVYALGVLAFEILTGAHPFPADTAMRQLLAHLETPPPTFAAVGADPDLPPALELVVMRALQKDPDARFATALALGDALVAAAAGRAPDAFPPSQPVLAAVDGGSGRPGQPTLRARGLRTNVARPTGEASARGVADTMIASAPVTLTPTPSRSRLVPIALVVALVVAVVVLLMTRGESSLDVAAVHAEGAGASNPGGAPPSEGAGAPHEPRVAERVVEVEAPDAGPTDAPDTTRAAASGDPTEADAET
ncbi:MAG: serine/threonine protein kinase, partial [Deltaproteobacteria bacterium]